MRRTVWLGIGLTATVLLVGAMSAIPTTAANLQSFLGLSATSGSSDANLVEWNSGNLCTTIQFGPGPGDISCVSNVHYAHTPLWYNFSSGGQPGAVVNVTIYGSNACIYMNFRGVYKGEINIDLLGSNYGCPSGSGRGDGGWGSGGSWSVLGPSDWQRGSWSSGCSNHSWQWAQSQSSGVVEWSHQQKSCAPGVNIAVNSEDDAINLVQSGRDYATNMTIYSRTTFVNATQSRCSEGLNITVTYIGITGGFKTCPAGLTSGRVTWSEVSYGSRNTFNTIFVNAMNAKHLPPNLPYSTEPLAPPDGTSYGWGNLYGNETTTTVPAGSCHYLVE